jgi:2-C-methyl-D-erythritol 2,4-cyclodiphosphate synthase
LRIGHGYDAHRLISGRRLVIGGVTIPHEKGLDGHSDADVLLHAVIDALLGAAGLGDIGGMFPDNDPAYKHADSIELLKSAFSELKTKGFVVGNIDATVIAQAPILKPYIPQMRLNIALACKTAPENVNVKATTEERMGFTGRLEGIAAHAVCLILIPIRNIE